VALRFSSQADRESRHRKYSRSTIFPEWYRDPVGVLRIFILLVGIWSLADRRAGQTGERSSSRRFGGKGKKETRGVLA
jgi:hypothetical protein